MTSDQLRHPHERFNYTNALSGLRSVLKIDGVQGLFRGLGVNTVCRIVLRMSKGLNWSVMQKTRAILMNVSQSSGIVRYDMIIIIPGISGRIVSIVPRLAQEN